MFVFVVKLILLFLVFILAVKLLGKSALAQLTPYDFGAIIFLAYLAFGPIKIKGIEEGIVGIVVITIVHLLISRLSLLNWLNTFIIGRPTILIKHSKIIFKNLKKSRYSLAELLSNLRASGYPDIKDIEYAILEANGEISILPKKELVPVTRKDLDIKTEYSGLPIAVVIEGKVQGQNLKLINQDERWLKSKLKAKGYHRIQDIFYASVRDNDHSMTVITKDIDDQL
ncbi:DUF421 domain-containing protein [Bacillus haynesii]|uniref:DUF421 domain-containing protein n=1 Tax=Bacillus haynesii TaxID=1925021 RepID=UPI002281062E|nr:DUF421 domain-containing protein [Bacillus haynesii]MCY7771435.1 DUF421 domain-containing protein [Bacillus haynesii]MCY7815503.1 DUF421 domain-containing protein [Bacillus haynesii]MCY7914383.1 DUF421 domain-containing protein [Bacillus haynesii]MCY7926401.1 DUF421 domain-containing protein [Bacillus haynesii]MCY8009457.1 DUF421 domain-containing protein [Bacillus haynesii]